MLHGTKKEVIQGLRRNAVACHGGEVSDFAERSVMRVDASTLLALRGGSNFQEKTLRTT